LYAVVVSGAMFSACGIADSPAQSAEQAVRARSEARWQAMMAEDYEKAYGYLAPGYRSRVSLESYRGRFVGKTRWTGINIQGVECKDDVCEVSVGGSFQFLGAPPVPPFEGENEMKEKWVLSDGEWWHVPRH